MVCKKNWQPKHLQVLQMYLYVPYLDPSVFFFCSIRLFVRFHLFSPIKVNVFPISRYKAYCDSLQKLVLSSWHVWSHQSRSERQQSEAKKKYEEDETKGPQLAGRFLVGNGPNMSKPSIKLGFCWRSFKDVLSLLLGASSCCLGV